MTGQENVSLLTLKCSTFHKINGCPKLARSLLGLERFNSPKPIILMDFLWLKSPQFFFNSFKAMQIT